MGLNNPKPTPDITYQKTADETVSNSVALQDDDELAGINLEANKTYKFEILLLIDSSAVADFKTNLVASQNVDFVWMIVGGVKADGTTYAGDVIRVAGGTTGGTNHSPGGSGAGVINGVWGFGAITVRAVACTLKLVWAQNTAEISNTVLKAGSKIEVWKLS